MRMACCYTLWGFAPKERRADLGPRTCSILLKSWNCHSVLHHFRTLTAMGAYHEWVAFVYSGACSPVVWLRAAAKGDAISARRNSATHINLINVGLLHSEAQSWLYQVLRAAPSMWGSAVWWSPSKFTFVKHIYVSRRASLKVVSHLIGKVGLPRSIIEIASFSWQFVWPPTSWGAVSRQIQAAEPRFPCSRGDWGRWNSLRVSVKYSTWPCYNRL